jgi:hypothetical protein
MRKYAGVLATLLMLALGPRAPGQRTASTDLMVRIGPEARIEPNRIPLQFRVSADRHSDQVVQTANIAAWVRSLPQQRIRVSARLLSLAGPGGPLAPAELGWTGAATGYTAGGHQAMCTSGAFATGQAQDLVAGWQKSGTLRCAIAFRLLEPQHLAAGLYTGSVDLSVEVR